MSEQHLAGPFWLDGRAIRMPGCLQRTSTSGATGRRRDLRLACRFYGPGVLDLHRSVTPARHGHFMPTIMPDEARAKFGELMHRATQTCDLVSYRFHKLHRLTKRLPKWRPRRR